MNKPTIIDYVLTATLKKLGGFLDLLRAKKVIEQFPLGNIKKGLSNLQKVLKGGGVSFLSFKIDKKQDINTAEVIHVK